MLNWKATSEDQALIEKIGDRFVQLLQRTHGPVSSGARADILMDVTCVHLNVQPLRLAELLAADEFNFSHDLIGIRENLVRNELSPVLKNHFVPRFADMDAAKPVKAALLAEFAARVNARIDEITADKGDTFAEVITTVAAHMALHKATMMDLNREQVPVFFDRAGEVLARSVTLLARLALGSAGEEEQMEILDFAIPLSDLMVGIEPDAKRPNAPGSAAIN